MFKQLWRRIVTKTEHFQFLALMIPTLLILVAAAISMADLALPAGAVETHAAATQRPAE
jgi:hypothetical protein